MLLTVRIHAGFNAAVLLGGILALSWQSSGTATAVLNRLFPGIDAAVRFGPASVGGIGGWRCRIEAPHEHAHRHLSDIAAIYDRSALSPAARAKADAVWDVLGRAEAAVHGLDPAEVHFHEVGRMANILAVGLIAEFLTRLGDVKLSASPIPMTDSTVMCAHGAVPYPAPALFAMLDGVAVRPWAGEGEPVTPTGLALLRGLGARFGGWPKMTVTAKATVFSDQAFEGVPNGTLFAAGTPPADESDD